MDDLKAIINPTAISESLFGKLPDGRDITTYELSNSTGVSVRVLNYGGILQSIVTPDRDGVLKDIILGFDDLEGYLDDDTYQGALVGRFANRIAGGRFRINGIDYELTKNDGDNCLHGGDYGFNRILWNSQIIVGNGSDILRLQHVSPHSDQGFPGELQITVDYALSSANELSIKMTATTDRDTVVNLTIHPYFNLSGDFSKSILDHVFRVKSKIFLPVSSSMIPLGERRNVQNTAFDFSIVHKIGELIFSDSDQLKLSSGYDHYFITERSNSNDAICAELLDPSSGRRLKVYSNASGIQFYTGNYLSKDVLGKGGEASLQYGGVSIEPQAFPNSPNEEDFPSTILKSGEKYEHKISFHFSTD